MTAYAASSQRCTRVSEKPVTKLSEASGQQVASSVYDFLYHDARRVGSFLAQLSPYGHLSGVEHNASASSGSKSTSKVGGGIEVPLVAKGTLGADREISEGDQKGLRRTYDPFWTNALDLYEKLDSAGLIERDISKAGLGQFVLVKGSLAIIDLRMVKDAWSVPSIRRLATQDENDYTGMTKAQKTAAKHETQMNMNMMLDLLPIMPHVVQGSLRSGQDNIWASLADECMVASAAEIVLRHGAVLKGQWHMLGILDATPQRDDEPTVGPGLTAATIGAMNAFGATMMGQVAITLAPVVRTLMGRPDHHYAVTPVMIFREATGAI
jgi:hypothetical protein